MRLYLAGVLALMLAACTCPCSHAEPGDRQMIRVLRFPSGEMLAQLPLAMDGRFSLSFIHSVSGTRVVDLYQARGGRIVQTAERFMTHGAGLPSHPDEPGGLTWEKDGDEFVLTMERPIPKLVVRTDKNYDNRLTAGRTTLNLNQWEDQALLLQSVCR